MTLGDDNRNAAVPAGNDATATTQRGGYGLAPALISAILLWTFAVTCLRGLRAPNDFAEAHWLLDYRFGLIKRGLVGSLGSVATAALGVTMTPLLIGVLSGVIYGGFCAAILLVLRRFLRQAANGAATGAANGAAGGTAGGAAPAAESAALAALVFVSSPFVVMSAHVFGYFDALLYLLALAAIVLVGRDRPYAAAALQGAAILIHESYLLLGYPLVLFASWLAAGDPVRPAGLRRHASAHALALLPLAVLLAAQFAGDAVALRAQIAGYLTSFDFVATRVDDVALYQTTGFFANLGQNVDLFARRVLDPRLAMSVAPSLFVLVYCGHAILRIAPFSRTSLVWLGVTAAPYLLHAVAWDTERIATYAVGSAMVGLWLLAEARRTGGWSPLLPLAAVPALVLNVFYRIPLMDGDAERFSLLWRALLYAPALALAVILVLRIKRQVTTSPAPR
ncbi:MAG: hypothetical protein RBT60_08330 [Candidatus Krumholzibacteria bacterium]|jgi:hypothetical protein|nr:hypothetical protein [Candidatus Krumholzibacteria bacterium]